MTYASLAQEVKNCFPHARHEGGGALDTAPFTFNHGLHFTPVPYE